MFPSSKLTESQSQFFSARMARVLHGNTQQKPAPPRVHCYTKAGILTWDHLTKLYQHKCIHIGRHCEHHLSITLLLLRSREGRRLINPSPGQSNVLWAKKKGTSQTGADFLILWHSSPGLWRNGRSSEKHWRRALPSLYGFSALGCWSSVRLDWFHNQKKAGLRTE